MIDVYRIVKKEHENLAFSGIGGLNSPGRWNLKGTPIIYTSASISLAALEIIVHWQPLGKIPSFVLCHAQIPKASVDTVYDTINLRDPKYNLTGTQRLGNAWFSTSKSLALKVPSAIIPPEFNYIINPYHKDFFLIKIESAVEFVFDKRLYI